MNLDFSLILVLVTLLTGILWLVDTLMFAPRRRAALAQAEQSAGAPLPEAQTD